MVFVGENPIEMNDLGVARFQEMPIYEYIVAADKWSVDEMKIASHVMLCPIVSWYWSWILYSNPQNDWTIFESSEDTQSLDINYIVNL